MAEPSNPWDNDMPDTRERLTPVRDASGWDQTGESTFFEPSRIGEQKRRAAKRRRRVVLLVAGLGVAALAAGGIALALRRA